MNHILSDLSWTSQLFKIIDSLSYARLYYAAFIWNPKIVTHYSFFNNIVFKSFSLLFLFLAIIYVQSMFCALVYVLQGKGKNRIYGPLAHLYVFFGKIYLEKPSRLFRFSVIFKIGLFIYLFIWYWASWTAYFGD